MTPWERALLADIERRPFRYMLIGFALAVSSPVLAAIVTWSLDLLTHRLCRG